MIQRYDAGNYQGVIAHSFGCDLALNMTGHTKRPIQEMILLSPIRDLALGFANLGNILGKKTEAAALMQEIEKRNGLSSSAQEIDKFWVMIQAMITDPAFYRAYWADEDHYKLHMEMMPKLPPLDLSMWQTGITDFLRNKTASPPATALKKKVFLGDKDPYYLDVGAEKLAWEKLGFSVGIEKNCGHYPHIEGHALED